MYELNPERTLRQLHGRIKTRAPKANKLWKYYDGDHPLGFSSQKFQEAFGGMFKAFSTNWMALVVDSSHQRLHVEGFRVELGDKPSPTPDREAWANWQANGLDAYSQLAHQEALVTGEGYATVWYPDRPGDAPVVTLEPSTAAIVALDPKNARRRSVGLRLWVDDAGFEHAQLFFPDRVYLWKSTHKVDGASSSQSMRWKPDGSSVTEEAEIDQHGNEWIKNPLGVVPIVPITNKPRLMRNRSLDTTAQSEIAGVIPVQDAVNKLAADMIVAAEYGALPQRYATGIEVEEDENGNPIEPFKQWQRLWLTEAGDGEFGSAGGSGVSFGQFPSADLQNFVRGIELLVQHIASQSATPPHYFYLKGAFPSGESIRSAEASLIAKVRDRMRTYGEAWEEVTRISMAISSSNLSYLNATVETVWADPETRTEAEHVDALIKLGGIGVPAEALWEKAGFSPTEIDRFRTMRSSDGLMAALAGELTNQPADTPTPEPNANPTA